MSASSLFLLDADVVIELCEIGIWRSVLSKTRVGVASSVAHHEALFYRTRAGRVVVDLPAEVRQGCVCELRATQEDIAGLINLFDAVFSQAIHPGEIEALSLLYFGKVEGWFFCTGDRAALEGAAQLGMGEKTVSLEVLLDSIGLRKPLQHQFTEEYRKKCLARGQQHRIARWGIGSSSG